MSKDIHVSAGGDEGQMSNLRKELIKADMEDMSELSKYALMTIGLTDRIGSTRLQKVLFFMDRIFRCGGDAEPYHFGAFSEDLAEEVQTMIDDGTVCFGKGKYGLTDYGENLIQEVLKDFPHVADFLNIVSHLSDDEVLLSTYKLFPEYTDISLIKHKLPKCDELHFASINITELEHGEKEIVAGDIKIRFSVVED